jgi:hypothetical protein
MPQMSSQHGAYALHAGKARLHARTLMHTPTHPGTHMHAHTSRPTRNSYCSSTATMIRVRASILRYTYIACLVIFLTVRINSYRAQQTVSSKDEYPWLTVLLQFLFGQRSLTHGLETPKYRHLLLVQPAPDWLHKRALFSLYYFPIKQNFITKNAVSRFFGHVWAKSW